MQTAIKTPKALVGAGAPLASTTGQSAFTDADQDFSTSDGSALPSIATMTPTAGRTVDLPPVAKARGRWFSLKNLSGAETIQVRDADASNVGAAIAVSSVGTYYCNGTTWRKMLVVTGT